MRKRRKASWDSLSGGISLGDVGWRFGLLLKIKLSFLNGFFDHLIKISDENLIHVFKIWLNRSETMRLFKNC